MLLFFSVIWLKFGIFLIFLIQKVYKGGGKHIYNQLDKKLMN